MLNKYNMTVEENIFFAKRNIIDYIWKSAKLEGLSVTFPDTESIYNNFLVSNIRADEIVAVNNLKHAWQFLLDNVEYEIDYQYVCKLNQLVGSNLFQTPGYTRTFAIRIGGTSWQPDMPNETEIKETILGINKISCATERAIKLMLYLMRTQAFFDGNKRTAMLAANQIMISNGAGIISVPIELQEDFRSLLVNFYKTNDDSKISNLIYNSCIDGVVISKEHQVDCYKPENDFYLKVTYSQAILLKKNNIKFEGKVFEDKLNVIRINVADKEKVFSILNQNTKRL